SSGVSSSATALELVGKRQPFTAGRKSKAYRNFLSLIRNTDDWSERFIVTAVTMYRYDRLTADGRCGIDLQQSLSGVTSTIATVAIRITERYH
ncbi:MAG: hypothetical protein V5A34_08820, partial [Halapricum sp.]